MTKKITATIVLAEGMHNIYMIKYYYRNFGILNKEIIRTMRIFKLRIFFTKLL
jgi:hypothetical protein